MFFLRGLAGSGRNVTYKKARRRKEVNCWTHDQTVTFFFFKDFFIANKKKGKV
jgi:hypothetical protein